MTQIPLNRHIVGSNEKIVLEAFDDPVVNVHCYVSYTTGGGIPESLGFAALARIGLSCHATGNLTVTDAIRNGRRDGEEVFVKSNANNAQALRVLRYYDARRRNLIYLGYSIEADSIQQILSAVPLPLADE